MNRLGKRDVLTGWPTVEPRSGPRGYQPRRPARAEFSLRGIPYPSPTTLSYAPAQPGERGGSVSSQMESRHFFRVGDTVEEIGGDTGKIVEGTALYAVVEWSDGRREEVDQFDPRIGVIERAAQSS